MQHHPIHGLPAFGSAFEWAGFAAIFSYSFIVSFHCLGMCGPLACSILGKTSLKAWQSSLLYNFGRGVSYVLAGVLSGFLSSQLVSKASLSLPSLTLWVSVLFGSLICLWSLSSFFGWPKQKGTSVFAKALRSVQDFVLRLPPALSAFGLGFLTILLPCMTLHPLLLVSASHQDAALGGVTMLAFFAGTVPAMVSATYMPTLIARQSWMIRSIRFGQIFLFIAGLLTIARGFIKH